MGGVIKERIERKLAELERVVLQIEDYTRRAYSGQPVMTELVKDIEFSRLDAKYSNLATQLSAFPANMLDNYEERINELFHRYSVATGSDNSASFDGFGIFEANPEKKISIDIESLEPPNEELREIENEHARKS